MPPQQSDRPLDVLDQLFRLGAHDSLIPFDSRDLATAQRQRNPAFELDKERQDCRSVQSGAVPGLNASRITLPSPPCPARIPVLASMRISLMPEGTRNGTAGLSASATLRNSATIGAASPPPDARLPM